MFDFFRLLAGTVILRPYVFLFLAAYLVAAAAHIGWKRTLLFAPIGYAIAWSSEYSSIHWGFPYGDYYYLPHTLDRELWIAGVPFMDSLSYVFLSYFSYATAIFLLSPVTFSKNGFAVLDTHHIRQSMRTLVLGSFLFVFLDIIIDPVALQGNRWFLGQIYGYRTPGLYFGIPISNFAGWLLVGFVLIKTLQILDRIERLEPRKASFLHRFKWIALFGPLLYVCVALFNLAVTFWIGDILLGLVGSFLLFFPVLIAFFLTLYKQDHLVPGAVDRHLEEFPYLKRLRLDISDQP